jgi:hypothetical protein
MYKAQKIAEYSILFRRWTASGLLGDSEKIYIENDREDTSGYEILSEFLIDKVNRAENVNQLLNVIGFTNYLLSRNGAIIGALQNFINAVIGKLRSLALSLGGVYFHIDVGISVHVSITFQVNPIQTR